MFKSMKKRAKRIMLYALAIMLVVGLFGVLEFNAQNKTAFAVSVQDNAYAEQRAGDRNVTTSELEAMGYTFSSYALNADSGGGAFLNGVATNFAGTRYVQVLTNSSNRTQFLFFVVNGNVSFQWALAPNTVGNPAYGICQIKGWGPTTLSFGSPRSATDLFVDAYGRVYYDFYYFSFGQTLSRRFYLSGIGGGMGDAGSAGTVTKPLSSASISNYSPQVGNTLYATVAPSGATATYQWYRGNIPIYGATSAYYIVTAADVGSTLKVQATGYGSYKDTRVSSATYAVPKLNQSTISINSSGEATFGTPYIFSSSGGSGTGGWSYSVTNVTGAAQVYGAYMFPTKPGIVYITAVKLGDSTYNASAPKSFTVTIKKANQTAISIDGLNATDVLTPIKLRGQGGSGTGAYSFRIDTSSSSYASITADGTLTPTPNTITSDSVKVKVWVKKLGDVNYNEIAEVSKEITISKATQSPLTIRSAQAVTYYEGMSYQTMVTGGSGNGKISFELNNELSTGVCSFDLAKGTLSNVTKTGEFSITATKAGNSDYKQSETTFTLTIDKATQTIDLSKITKQYSYNTHPQLIEGTATAKGVVSFSPNSFTEAGTYQIIATAAATDLYKVAVQTFEITVNKIDQSGLTLNGLTHIFGSNLTLSASGGSGDGQISYAITGGTGQAVINGDKLTPQKVGTIKIVATKAGDNNYNAISSSEATITISQKEITPSDFTLEKTVYFVGDSILVKKNDTAISETYKWFVSEDNSNWTELSGETNNAYEIKPEDLGKFFKVDILSSGNHTGTVSLSTTEASSYNIAYSEGAVFSNNTYTLTGEGKVTFTYQSRSLEIVASSNTKITLENANLFDNIYPCFEYTIEPLDQAVYKITDWQSSNVVFSTKTIDTTTSYIIYSLSKGEATSQADTKYLDFTFIVDSTVTSNKEFVKQYKPSADGTATFGTLPVPFVTGKTFSGWYKEESFTNKIEPTTSIPKNSNVKYYANFKGSETALNAIEMTIDGQKESYTSLNEAIEKINSLTNQAGDITINMNGYVFGNGDIKLTNITNKVIIQSKDTANNKIVFAKSRDFVSTNSNAHKIIVSAGATLQFNDVEFLDIEIENSGTVILGSGVQITKEKTLITSTAGTVRIEDGVSVSNVELKAENTVTSTAVATINGGKLVLNVDDVSAISRNFAINLGGGLGGGAYVEFVKPLTNGYLIISEIDSSGQLVVGTSGYATKEAVKDTKEENLPFGRVKITNSGITLTKGLDKTLNTSLSSAIHAVRRPDANDLEFTLGYATLKEAIDAAKSGETIFFVRRIVGGTTTGNVYEENITLTANKTLTITSGIRAVSGEYGTVVTVVSDDKINTNTLNGKITIEPSARLNLVNVNVKGDKSEIINNGTLTLNNVDVGELTNNGSSTTKVEGKIIISSLTLGENPIVLSGALLDESKISLSTSQVLPNKCIIATAERYTITQNDAEKILTENMLSTLSSDGKIVARYLDITLEAGEGKFGDKGSQIVIEHNYNKAPSISDKPTRADYKFIGWSETEGGASVGGDFKLTIDDTLYAVWQEKTKVQIDDAIQQKTYTGSKIPFAIKGTDEGLTDFVVKYSQGSVNELTEWEGIVPTRAGTYNVKITRAEETVDEGKASFEKVIEGGLVIDKAVLEVSIKDFAHLAGLPQNKISPSITITGFVGGEGIGNIETDMPKVDFSLVSKDGSGSFLPGEYLISLTKEQPLNYSYELSSTVKFFVVDLIVDNVSQLSVTEGTHKLAISLSKVGNFAVELCISDKGKTLDEMKNLTYVNGAAQTEISLPFAKDHKSIYAKVTITFVVGGNSYTEVFYEEIQDRVLTVDKTHTKDEGNQIKTTTGALYLTDAVDSAGNKVFETLPNAVDGGFVSFPLNMFIDDNGDATFKNNSGDEFLVKVGERAKLEANGEETSNQTKTITIIGETDYYYNLAYEAVGKNSVETKYYGAWQEVRKNGDKILFANLSDEIDYRVVSVKKDKAETTAPNEGEVSGAKPIEKVETAVAEDGKTITVTGTIEYEYNLSYQNQNGEKVYVEEKWIEANSDGEEIVFDGLDKDTSYLVEAIKKDQVVSPDASGIIPGETPAFGPILEVKEVSENEGGKTITVIGNVEHFYNVYYKNEEGKNIYVSDPWKEASVNGEEVVFSSLDKDKQYVVVAIDRNNLTTPPAIEPEIDLSVLPSLEVVVDKAIDKITPQEDTYIIVEGKFGYEYNVSYEDGGKKYLAENWISVKQDGEKIIFTGLKNDVNYVVEKRAITPISAEIFVRDITKDSITIVAIPGFEYNVINESGALVSSWQSAQTLFDRLTFNSLSPNTEYSFVARKQADFDKGETLSSVQSQSLYPIVRTLSEESNTAKSDIEKLLDAIAKEIYPKKTVGELDKDANIVLSPDVSKKLIDVIKDINTKWEGADSQIKEILSEKFEKVVVNEGLIGLKDKFNSYDKKEYYSESENLTHNYEVIEDIYEKALSEILKAKTKEQADVISDQANSQMELVKKMVVFLKDEKLADLEKLFGNYSEHDYIEENWKKITNSEPKGIVEKAMDEIIAITTLADLKNYNIYLSEEQNESSSSVQKEIEKISTILNTSVAESVIWLENNKNILDKAVSEITEADKVAIDKAISEYELLSEGAKNLVPDERKDLEEKRDRLKEIEIEKEFENAEDPAKKWKENNKDIILVGSFIDNAGISYGKELAKVETSDQTAVEEALFELTVLNSEITKDLLKEKVDLETKLWKTKNPIIYEKIDDVIINELASILSALNTLPDVTKAPHNALPDSVKKDIADIKTDLEKKRDKFNDTVNTVENWKESNKDIILKGSYQDTTNTIFGKTLEEVTLDDLGQEGTPNKILGAISSLSALIDANADVGELLTNERADLEKKKDKLAWVEENKVILGKDIADIIKTDLGENIGTADSPIYENNTINYAILQYDKLSESLKNALTSELASLNDKKAKLEFVKKHEVIIEKAIGDIINGNQDQLKADIKAIEETLEGLTYLKENVKTGLEKTKKELTEKLDEALVKEWLVDNATIIGKVTAVEPLYEFKLDDLNELREALIDYDKLPDESKKVDGVKTAIEIIIKILEENDASTKDALKWKEDNKDILATTYAEIKDSDKALTKKALQTYETLSEAAKGMLKAEKADVDTKNTAILWNETYRELSETPLEKISKTNLQQLEKAISDYKKLGLKDGEIFKMTYDKLISMVNVSTAHKVWYDNNAPIIEKKIADLKKEDLSLVKKALQEYANLSKTAKDIETKGPISLTKLNEGLFPKPNLDTKLDYALTLSQSFKVTFELNGGSFPSGVTANSTMIYYNQPVPIQLSNPEKSTYEFAGWFKDKQLTQPWNFSYDMVTAQTRIYAKWDKAPISITIVDGNGVENVVAVASGTALDKAKVDSIINKTNVDGYYVDATLKTPYNFTKEVTESFTLYYKVVTEKFTAKFDSKGGSEVGAIADIAYGSAIAKPQDPTKADASFVGWYQDSELTIPWNFEASQNQTKIKGNITLLAKWRVDDSSEITGVIVDKDGKPITSGITGQLKAGNTVYSNVVISADGNFTISNVVNDTYNLVLCKENGVKTDIIKTVKVTVDGQNLNLGKVIMPEIITNSKVEAVGESTPEIVADGVYKIFEGSLIVGEDGEETHVTDDNFSPADRFALHEGYSIEIVLKGEKKELSSTKDVELLSKLIKADSHLIMDFTLTKTLENNGGKSSTIITVLANTLEIKIPLPAELRNLSGMKVYRVHNGVVDIITESKNADGEYFTYSSDKSSIVINAKKFSTFAIKGNSSSLVDFDIIGNEEKPTVSPEPTTPTEPTEKPDPTIPSEVEESEKQLSILNLLLVLSAIAVLVLAIIKKKKFMIATSLSTLVILVLLILTTGFDAVIFANLWSIVFAIILAAIIILNFFPNILKKKVKEQNSDENNPKENE